MPLFIDRADLLQWTDNTRQPPWQLWSARIRAFLTEPGLEDPPAGLQPLEWVVDTGSTCEAVTWRHHLIQCQLDPDSNRSPERLSARWTVNDRSEKLPIRLADLWLVSPLPDFGGGPVCLPLNRGVAFSDQHVANPDPVFHRAIIGMPALRRAGIRIDIDFAARRYSVWVPESVPVDQTGDSIQVV